jgi:hypothetical protein
VLYFIYVLKNFKILILIWRLHAEDGRAHAGCRRYATGALFSSLKIPSFFTLSITSIFSCLHGVLNIGKKNN